jgi:hypothetical protein
MHLNSGKMLHVPRPVIWMQRTLCPYFPDFRMLSIGLYAVTVLMARQHPYYSYISKTCFTPIEMSDHLE